MNQYKLKNDHAASIGHVRESHTLLTTKIDALRIDQVQPPISSLNLANQKIINLATPISDSDAARWIDVKDSSLLVNIERDRALAAEQELQDQINSLSTSSQIQQAIQDALQPYSDTTEMNQAINQQVSTEQNRAITAEQQLQDQIDNLELGQTGQQVTEAINAAVLIETNARTDQDTYLLGQINSEKNRAQLAETALNTRVNGVYTKTEIDTTVASLVQYTSEQIQTVQGQIDTHTTEISQKSDWQTQNHTQWRSTSLGRLDSDGKPIDSEFMYIDGTNYYIQANLPLVYPAGSLVQNVWGGRQIPDRNAVYDMIDERIALNSNGFLSLIDTSAATNHGDLLLTQNTDLSTLSITDRSNYVTTARFVDGLNLTEAAARIMEDAAINQRIDTLTATTATTAQLNQAIADEIQLRTSVDQSLQSQINTKQSATQVQTAITTALTPYSTKAVADTLYQPIGQTGNKIQSTDSATSLTAGTNQNGISIYANSQSVGSIGNIIGQSGGLLVNGVGNLGLTTGTGSILIGSTSASKNTGVYIQSGLNDLNTNCWDQIVIGSGFRQQLTLISGFSNSIPYNAISIATPIAGASSLSLTAGNSIASGGLTLYNNDVTSQTIRAVFSGPVGLSATQLTQYSNEFITFGAADNRYAGKTTPLQNLTAPTASLSLNSQSITNLQDLPANTSTYNKYAVNLASMISYVATQISSAVSQANVSLMYNSTTGFAPSQTVNQQLYFVNNTFPSNPFITANCYLASSTAYESVCVLKYTPSIVDLTKYRVFASFKSLTIPNGVTDYLALLKTNNYGFGYDIYNPDSNNNYLRLSWGQYSTDSSQFQVDLLFQKYA